MKKYILFSLFNFVCILSYTQVRISAQEVDKHLGQTVTVCTKVYAGRFLESYATQPTLLNLGGFYPNHLLTVMIAVENRKNFSFKPEDFYVGKNICVTGKLIDYRGKPEIVVTNPSEISVENEIDLSKPQTTLDEQRRQAKGEKPKQSDRTADKALTSTSGGSTSSDPSSVTDRPKRPTKVRITSDINLRSGPGLRNSVIATLKKGTVLLIHLTQNEWSYVSVDGPPSSDPNNIILQGFVKSNVLK